MGDDLNEQHFAGANWSVQIRHVGERCPISCRVSATGNISNTVALHVPYTTV